MKVIAALAAVSSVFATGCHGDNVSMAKLPTRDISSLMSRWTAALNRSERKEQAKQEAVQYMKLRKQGFDEVSNTPESVAVRNYRLRSKKRTGLLWDKEVSLASVLFPGVLPQEYLTGEDIVMYADLVESRKTQVPFEFYDLPVCPQPSLKFKRVRKNLGARLQGHDVKPAPYSIKVKQNKGCTPICLVSLGGKKLRWMRKLVERQYRVQLTLDQLPVLMRSKELDYAVRGYPVGFKAPPSYTGLKNEAFYVYNHLRFIITYHEDATSFDGVRVTGFDVQPVSMQHNVSTAENLSATSKIATCNEPGAPDVVNNPYTYMALLTGPFGESVKVLYSYEVQWVASDLPWADRWDVYLLRSGDDSIRYYAITNSLILVLFLTGSIATIIIRTLRQDAAGLNEILTLEKVQEETGWKLVHGDVFRPPSTSSRMMFSVAVGTGAQIGFTFFLAMSCSVLKLLNPMNKGHTVTTILVLYILSGSVAGYVSARLYKFCDAKAWTLNIIYTAVALPSSMFSIFAVINSLLSMAGAATAVSFPTVIALYAMCCCVAAPLVFVGSYFGRRADKLDVPVKTSEVARVVPELPWHVCTLFTVTLGGIIPFSSVCIELFFIMSAIWRKDQIYFEVGFLLVVFLILTVTCAEVAVIITYLLLRSEDHRWWWKSFWNCASIGGYFLLYSLWFLSSRLNLVGVLPVVVFLLYISMISICFGLFCGSVGVLASFWFNRTLYGALKAN